MHEGRCWIEGQRLLQQGFKTGQVILLKSYQTQAVEDAETPEEAAAAEKARKLAGETADRLRKLVSEARNSDDRRGNISDLLLDLSDIENRIGRARETINEIQKDIDDNKDCGDGDEEDLVEAGFQSSFNWLDIVPWGMGASIGYENFTV